MTLFQRIYRFLSSSRLAMVLLVTILACCVTGVTIFRGGRAWQLIFNTLWFNSLLVLLVVNVAFCFFGRIWGRKVTLISLGMILFHLSFVAILMGVIYNSMFFFRGKMRLTEGETLQNGDLQSYDTIEHGRFFGYSKLKGETTLIRMHRGFQVDGLDKRAAYEIEVGRGSYKKKGIIYPTNNLDYNGFDYIPGAEGYSVFVLLYDKAGRDIYGAHIPLQSLKQEDDTYLYSTGTKTAPASFPFPQEPLEPLWDLQVAFKPDPKNDRSGQIFYKIWPLRNSDVRYDEKTLAEGKALVGEKFAARDSYLETKEIRYWVIMDIRYEPGRPIVLASLWSGLAGMVLTFIGRLRRSKQSAIRNGQKDVR